MRRSKMTTFDYGILFAASRSFQWNKKEFEMAANILVVEDDSSNRGLICKLLAKDGYQIVEASDGAQALKLLCTQRFDLVITDFVMPKVNGLKLVEELHSVHPRIPIIFITAYLSVTSGKTILDGAAEILPKPFELGVLRSTIQRTLRDSSASSSPDGMLRGKPDVMTREEIEELMEELTRQFAATRDPEIREELYELARELATMEESNFEKPSALKAPGQLEQKKVPMLLRDHPLMRYHGIPNWPPTWTWIGGFENKRPQGEVGILKTIELSNFQPANRFFLRI